MSVRTGVTLTGGDGLYVKDCYGCTFVDLVLDDNYRQACSVISASDTLFENCQFLNTGAHDRLQASFLAGLRCSHRRRCVAGMTGGTAPQAGVDFEPNDATDFLSNLTLRNCTAKNNVGGGYFVSYSNLDNFSEVRAASLFPAFSKV